jgi:hypothetical protein
MTRTVDTELEFNISLFWCITNVVFRDLAERIFRAHLFPELQETSEDDAMVAVVPVLNTTTRADLYRLMQTLCRQEENCRKIIHSVAELVPQRE